MVHAQERTADRKLSSFLQVRERSCASPALSLACSFAFEHNHPHAALARRRHIAASVLHLGEEAEHFFLHQQTGARGGAVGGAMRISLRVALALALALAVIAATEAAANVQFESAANQGDISSSDSWSASTTSGAQAQAVAGVVPVLLSLAVCGIVLLAQCL